MDVGGTGEPTRLTFDPAQDTEPSWSPGGEMITFQSKRDGNLDIYQVNADGSDPNPTSLTSHSAVDQSPSWGP